MDKLKSQAAKIIQHGHVARIDYSIDPNRHVAYQITITVEVETQPLDSVPG